MMLAQSIIKNYNKEHKSNYTSGSKEGEIAATRTIDRPSPPITGNEF